jgi:hypothetical protein
LGGGNRFGHSGIIVDVSADTGDPRTKFLCERFSAVRSLIEYDDRDSKFMQVANSCRSQSSGAAGNDCRLSFELHSELLLRKP